MHRIAKTGLTVTTGAASAQVTLPTSSGGFTPKTIRLVTNTGAAYIKTGKTTVTATANDIMITTTPTILTVVGDDVLAHIQETAAVKLNISTIEG